MTTKRQTNTTNLIQKQTQLAYANDEKMNAIKQFCKDFKLKYEDHSNNILITSKIIKSKAWKKSFASVPIHQKYRYFEYFYIKENDFICVDSKKMNINFTGQILTWQEIQRLKEKINLI